jgi:hypothetical protein
MMGGCWSGDSCEAFEWITCRVDCAMICADPDHDPQHCGGCYEVCDESNGFTCVNGTCACAGGATDCDGDCVNTHSDPTNCGSCGRACPPELPHCVNGDCSAESCEAGGGSMCLQDGYYYCVDQSSDPLHCGACGRVCDPELGSCVAGSCLCELGREDCGGECVDLLNDPAHCGGCYDDCPTQRRYCVEGSCRGSSRWEVHSAYVQDCWRLSAVWGLPNGEMWAVGGTFSQGTLIMHRDPASGGWEEVYSGGDDEDLNAVWASGPDDVWAAGTGGALLHWDGTWWNEDPRGLVHHNDLFGFAHDDVWAVGNGQSMHWDGVTWQSSDRGFTTVWGALPNRVWGAGPAVLAMWDGAAWVDDTTAEASAGASALWGSSSNDIWGTGERDPAYHWDGQSWSVGQELDGYSLYGVWGSAPDDFWAVGNRYGDSAILHWNGEVWSSSQSPLESSFYDVWGDAPDNVWIVGSRCAILRLQP